MFTFQCIFDHYIIQLVQQIGEGKKHKILVSEVGTDFFDITYNQLLHSLGWGGGCMFVNAAVMSGL